MKAKTLRNTRLARWVMMLSGYNFEIKYVKGITHTAADALSRYDFEKKSKNKIEVIKVTEDEPLTALKKNDYRRTLIRAQREDPIYKVIIERIQRGDKQTSYDIIDEVLFHYDKTLKQLLAMPMEYIPRLLYHYHDSNFGGHLRYT